MISSRGHVCHMSVGYQIYLCLEMEDCSLSIFQDYPTEPKYIRYVLSKTEICVFELYLCAYCLVDCSPMLLQVQRRII